MKKLVSSCIIIISLIMPPLVNSENVCLSCSIRVIQESVLSRALSDNSIRSFIINYCVNEEMKINKWFDISNSQNFIYFYQRYENILSYKGEKLFARECYLGRYIKYGFINVDVSILIIVNSEHNIFRVIGKKETDIW